MANITLNHLVAKKQNQEKFTVLTAYDATFSHMLSTSGIDVLMVGDSLGMVMQGHDSTVPVQLFDVAYHTKCVARGNQGSLIISDFPFMTYTSTEQAISSATTLMQAGGHVVKLEGGAWLCDTVKQLSERGIPVCAHLGLTPQSIHQLGGYKVQGKTDEDAKRILNDALALQEAGARLLVLECVPSSLAREITEKLHIPTIGIGAGPDTDGQVLVLQDMLGVTPGEPPKFVRDFMKEGNGSIQAAITTYINAVKTGSYPGPHEVYE